MADDFSVKAILSAEDKGFNKAINTAISMTKSLGNTISKTTSGISSTVSTATNIATKATSIAKSGVSGVSSAVSKTAEVTKGGISKTNSVVSSAVSLVKRSTQSAINSGASLVKSVTSTVSSINNHLNNLRQKAASALSGVSGAFKSAGLAITGLGISSLKSYGDFQNSLNKAAIVAGGTSKDIKGLADVANDVGRTLPVSAKEGADAMIGMAQNGAGLRQLKSEFPAIAKAATAAGADLNQTADAVMQSMNIWGGSVTKNAELLVQTANLSNAQIETMGPAFANVGTNAHALGMDLQTTATAIGLLTNKGMTSERASQDLNHALVQMIKPSSAAQKVMKKLGISYEDSHHKMKPFRQILSEMSDALSKYTPAQQKSYEATMLGTAGMSAIAPLIDSVRDKSGNAATSWDTYTKKMNEAAGSSKTAGKTLDKQAKEMQKNVGAQLKLLGHNWTDLRNTAMKSMNGTYYNVVKNMNGIIQKLRTGKAPIDKFARSFASLTPIIGPAFTAMGTGGQILAGLATLNPVILILGAVVAAFALITLASPKAQKKFNDFVGSSKKQGSALNQLQKTLHKIVNGFKDFAKAFTKTGNFSATWRTIGRLFKTIGQIIKQIAENVPGLGTDLKNAGKNGQSTWSAVGTWFGQILNKVTQTTNKVLDFIKAFMKMPAVKATLKFMHYLLQYIKALIVDIIANIPTMINAFVKTGNLQGLWTSISKLFKSIWSLIKTIASLVPGLGDKLKNSGIEGKNGFQTFGKVLGAVSRAIQDIANFLTKLTNGIKRTIQAFMQTTSIQKIWQSIVKLFQDYWNLINTILTLIPGFNEKMNDLGGNSTDVFTEMGNALGAVANGIETVINWLDKFINGFKVMIKTVAKNTSVTKFWGSLKNLIGAIFNLIWQIIKVIPGVSTASSKLKKPMNVWKTIGNIISGVLNAIQFVINLITKAINGLTKSAGFKLLQWFVNTILNQIVKSMTVIWKSMRSVLTDFGKFSNKIMKSKPVQKAIHSIANAFGTIMNAIQWVILNIDKFIKAILKTKGTKKAVDTIAEAFTDISTAVSNVFTWFTNSSDIANTVAFAINVIAFAWDGLWDSINYVYNLLKNIITTWYKWSAKHGVIHDILGVVGQIKSFFSYLSKHSGPIGDAIHTIAKYMGKFFNYIKDNAGWAIPLIETIFAPITTAAKALKAVLSILGGVGNGIRKFNGHLKKAQELSEKGDGKHSLYQIGLGFKDTGAEISNGILSPIMDDLAMRKSTRGFALKYKNYMRKAFGIHSPSRLMRDEVGKYLVPGIIEGMNTSPLQNKMNSISDILTGKTGNFRTSFDNLKYTISAPDMSDMENQMSAQYKLQVQNRPAYINLHLGNHDYGTFVDDISHQQNNVSRLKELRGF